MRDIIIPEKFMRKIVRVQKKRINIISLIIYSVLTSYFRDG